LALMPSSWHMSVPSGRPKALTRTLGGQRTQ
jgi:hypothetical protein